MDKKKIVAPGRLLRAGGGPEDSFGVLLKQLRQDEGWSIRELGRRSHVSNSTLQNYEAGVSLPGVTELRKLRKVFGCSADFLIDGKPSVAKAVAGEPTFFGPHEQDLYPFLLAAGLRALPTAQRESAEVLLDALLVGAVGRKRLPRIAEFASWARFSILEGGGEWMPEVPTEGVPWKGGSFDSDGYLFDSDSQGKPEKPRE